MNTRVFYGSDADITKLKGKRLAILGYGSQGRAHALNLRDSGLEIVVGVRTDGRTGASAKNDGLTVTSAREAGEGADLIAFLIPDPTQPSVYREAIAPILREGQTLLFAHGFNIHYGQINPPPMVDVVMVAPKGPGNLVRRLFKAGQGVPSLMAVHQDPSGSGKATALAYAHALGATRAGVLETTFREETETDLFGEQAVLCGGVSFLIKAGYEALVEAGYAPEMAYFECCHELKLIVDLIHQGGLKNMRHFVSDTAKFGDVTRGPVIIDESIRKKMRDILADIQSGAFAREWILENRAGRPVYNALLRAESEHQLDEVGDRMRAMMNWLG